MLLNDQNLVMYDWLSDEVNDKIYSRTIDCNVLTFTAAANIFHFVFTLVHVSVLHLAGRPHGRRAIGSESIAAELEGPALCH